MAVTLLPTCMGDHINATISDYVYDFKMLNCLASGFIRPIVSHTYYASNDHGLYCLFFKDDTSLLLLAALLILAGHQGVLGHANG